MEILKKTYSYYNTVNNSSSKIDSRNCSKQVDRTVYDHHNSEYYLVAEQSSVECWADVPG